MSQTYIRAKLSSILSMGINGVNDNQKINEAVDHQIGSSCWESVVLTGGTTIWWGGGGRLSEIKTIDGHYL